MANKTITMANHKQLRELCAFQHWLGANYTNLPTDSGEMTKRARLYASMKQSASTVIVTPTYGEYTSEDYVNHIEQERFDKISNTSLATIASKYRELESCVDGSMLQRLDILEHENWVLRTRKWYHLLFNIK